MASYDDLGKVQKSAYVLEKGEYAFFVGNSVQNVRRCSYTYVQEADRIGTGTTQDGGFFPRVPAIFDGELPSPAALLVLALKKAQALRPDIPYGDAVDAIFTAAAPAMKHEPLACAALIDAANST